MLKMYEDVGGHGHCCQGDRKLNSIIYRDSDIIFEIVGN